MNYDRVVTAQMDNVAVSLVDDPIIELVMGANSNAEIIRVEIGAAQGATPLDEVQEFAMYTATAAGTGGTGLTETILQGGGTILGAATRNLTAPGAGLVEIWQTGFHWQNGYLYLPVPEERIRITSGGQDVFGFYFPVAPDAATTFSATLIWGEIG